MSEEKFTYGDKVKLRWSVSHYDLEEGVHRLDIPVGAEGFFIGHVVGDASRGVVQITSGIPNGVIKIASGPIEGLLKISSATEPEYRLSNSELQDEICKTLSEIRALDAVTRHPTIALLNAHLKALCEIQQERARDKP